MSISLRNLAGGLFVLAALGLGILFVSDDSTAQARSIALDSSPDRAPDQAPAGAPSPTTAYEFLDGDEYTTGDCAATLRVYVSSVPSVDPSWVGPDGMATQPITGSGSCSNTIRAVNRSDNGQVVSVDYPFYILNQNRPPGRFSVSFLGFTAYFNISLLPTPTPTTTPAYTDLVTGKVVDLSGKPMAGALVAAMSPAWVKRSFGGIADLRGVDCPTATKCIAVGSAGLIVGSSNGGLNWTLQDWVTMEDLRDVVCPTATTCFAVGGNGAMLSTTNGGSDWSRQTTDAPELQRLSCPTATTCFAVGGGRLAATTDGGTTWKSSSRFEAANDINCPTATACFVAGQGNQISATTDGGTSWSSQSTGAGVDSFTALSCPTTSTCFAAGPQAGDPLPLLTKTTNGGVTWSSEMRPFAAASSVVGLSCPTATACTIIGKTGPTSTTVDGGVTWRIGPTFQTYSYAIGALSCPTATSCVAVGEHGTVGTYLPVKLYEATTNSSGEYALTHLAPNSYTLTVIQGAHAFTPTTRDVTVPPSFTNQDFTADFVQPTFYLPVILAVDVP